MYGIICLQLGHFITVNVGKYTSTMEHFGHRSSQSCQELAACVKDSAALDNLQLGEPFSRRRCSTAGLAQLL